MHGAGGGAPKGRRNGNYKHGAATAEASALMRDLNMLARLLSIAPARAALRGAMEGEDIGV